MEWGAPGNDDAPRRGLALVSKKETRVSRRGGLFLMCEVPLYLQPGLANPLPHCAEALPRVSATEQEGGGSRLSMTMSLTLGWSSRKSGRHITHEICSIGRILVLFWKDPYILSGWYLKGPWDT